MTAELAKQSCDGRGGGKMETEGLLEMPENNAVSFRDDQHP